MFLVTNKSIYLFQNHLFKLIDKIDIFPFNEDEENDLINIALVDNTFYIMYLHQNKGYIGLNRYENFCKKEEKKFRCHKSEISNFAMNPKATHFATCSQDGLFIKLFDCQTGRIHLKFSRGKLRTSKIFSICFNTTSSLLATTSSSGYCKIYSTKLNENALSNKTDFLMSVLSLSSSSKRMFKFFVTKAKTICEFDSENEIYGKKF